MLYLAPEIRISSVPTLLPYEKGNVCKESNRHYLQSGENQVRDIWLLQIHGCKGPSILDVTYQEMFNNMIFKLSLICVLNVMRKPGRY